MKKSNTKNTQNTPNTAEPIFIPYCCHTPKEVVSILKSIYKKVRGNEFEFVRAVRKSADPRLKMNSFAVNVLYAFTDKIIKGEKS